MALFKGHPADGHKRYDYVSRKIAYLAKAGFIGRSNSGYGMNGGACPDWLLEEQKADQKRIAKDHARKMVREYRALLAA